jgi:hypothetical protein
MGISKLARGGIAGIVLRWAARLRFPYLFALTAVLFLVNLFLADPLPFADELLMGLVAILLGSLRKSRRDSEPPAPADGSP